jgi:hypothetical protein
LLNKIPFTKTILFGFFFVVFSQTYDWEKPSSKEEFARTMAAYERFSRANIVDRTSWLNMSQRFSKAMRFEKDG